MRGLTTFRPAQDRVAQKGLAPPLYRPGARVGSPPPPKVTLLGLQVVLCFIQLYLLKG